ncbi:MAG: hypothetical protein DRO40_06910 [Thermoprotei archaeon]|nr:MAG: hypothetical protein DRO40_06910 [Thermoprotei archaeon]
MPKTPSVLLKQELAKKQLELLDIYRFKTHDIIRVRHSMTNKVYLVKVEKHVSDIASEKDLDEIVKKIYEAVSKG